MDHRPQLRTSYHYFLLLLRKAMAVSVKDSLGYYRPGGETKNSIEIAVEAVLECDCLGWNLIDS